MLCLGPVRPERCEGCQTGQLGKQRPLMLGFMPWHPRQAGAFPGGGGLKKKSGCKPSIPLRGKRAGSEAFLAVGPPHQRAARRGVQDKQAQQPYRVNCRRELMRRGVKKKKNAPVAPAGGKWRGMEGSDGSKSEGAGDGPPQPPAGPLLWEHTGPNEFDSLLSSINHAMQNISPF